MVEYYYADLKSTTHANLELFSIKTLEKHEMKLANPEFEPEFPICILSETANGGLNLAVFRWSKFDCDCLVSWSGDWQNQDLNALKVDLAC